MEYFMQQDSELNDRLEKVGYKREGLDDFGCYYMALVNSISLLEGQVTRDKVVEVAKKALEQGVMEPDFFIAKPNRLIKLLAGDRYYYVGFGEVRNCDNKDGACLSIECWKDSRNKYKHFKLPWWDSYVGGTITNRNGYLHSYRVYGRKN